MGDARFDPRHIRTWAASVFATFGIPPEHAATVANVLVEANLRGVDSHGILRLPIYCERLRRGSVNPRPRIRTVAEQPASLLVDGDNGLGAVVADHAMGLCLERARQGGAAFVAVRNSNHFGMAGYYASMAARAGMFGLALSNAEANMAPHGGTAARFGTNPLALAVPGGPAGAVVLDIASSAAAWGKAMLAAQEGRPLPPGLFLDGNGRPTTDARAALNGGLALPFGGHKGSGLAFFIDILCGVLNGGRTSTEMANMYRDLDQPQGTGHLFAALHIPGLADMATFVGRVAGKAGELAATPALPGQRVMWPGQIEDETRAERAEHGIPLPVAVVSELETLGRQHGVPLPAREA